MSVRVRHSKNGLNWSPWTVPGLPAFHRNQGDSQNCFTRSSIIKCIKIAKQHFQINLPISPSPPQANNKLSHSKKTGLVSSKNVFVLFPLIWDHLLSSLKNSVPHPPCLSLFILSLCGVAGMWTAGAVQHSEDESTSCPVNDRSNTCTVAPLPSSRCPILEFGGFVR